MLLYYFVFSLLIFFILWRWSVCPIKTIRPIKTISPIESGVTYFCVSVHNTNPKSYTLHIITLLLLLPFPYYTKILLNLYFGYSLFIHTFRISPLRVTKNSFLYLTFLYFRLPIVLIVLWLVPRSPSLRYLLEHTRIYPYRWRALLLSKYFLLFGRYIPSRSISL